MPKRVRELELFLDSFYRTTVEALDSAERSLGENLLINLQRTAGWIAIERTKESLKAAIEQMEAEVCKLLNPRPGGSKAGRIMILRNFQEAYDTIISHYFQPKPLYGDHHFRRRFRMSKLIFGKVYDACVLFPFFKYRPNAAGRWGIHPLVKITAVLRHFAYGTCADQMDEQFQLSETTLMDSRKEFCDVRFTALHTLIGFCV